MATVTQQDVAPLHKHLNVTINKEDYLPTFEKSSEREFIAQERLGLLFLESEADASLARRSIRAKDAGKRSRRGQE